jgi:hypothetical protein
MTHILLNRETDTFQEFEDLEEARTAAIELLDDGDGVDADDLTLIKVGTEYSIVSSKKVLFKKEGSDTSE